MLFAWQCAQGGQRVGHSVFWEQQKGLLLQQKQCPPSKPAGLRLKPRQGGLQHPRADAHSQTDLQRIESTAQTLSSREL